MKALVYIAGPYRAETSIGVMDNIIRAQEVAVHLWNDGFAVLCPHTNTMSFEHMSTAPPEAYLQAYLHMMSFCDVVLMLHGWQGSYGARQEWWSAREWGIPIYYSLERLKEAYQSEHLVPPGSIEAVEAGCLCPVLDNEYGRGWMCQPGVYCYSSLCPIHGHLV